MINPDSDPKAAQSSVDTMAKALSVAEQALVTAMSSIVALQVPMQKFGTDIDTHWTFLPFEGMAEAMAHVGRGFASIADMHKTLDKLRRNKKFPEPDPVARDGGGGGKP